MAKDTIKWNLGLLMDTFGLTRLNTDDEPMPLLENWVASEGRLTIEEQKELDFLRKNLSKNVDNWDEESLKMKFIAFILRLCYYLYEEDDYQTFFDKAISATINGHNLSAKPDMMLALGIEDELKTPYFCFHEYKKSKPEKDPRAQLLIDMLIAQAVNENQIPIYGCYVTGGFWYFMVLEGKQFKISHAYDATMEAGLNQIVLILRGLWAILKKM